MIYLACVILFAGCVLAQGPQGRAVGPGAPPGNWSNGSNNTSPFPINGSKHNGSHERPQPSGHPQGGQHGKPHTDKKEIEEEIAHAMMEQLLKGEPVKIKVSKTSKVGYAKDGDSGSSEEDRMVPVTLDVNGKPVVGADKPHRGAAGRMFNRPARAAVGPSQPRVRRHQQSQRLHAAPAQDDEYRPPQNDNPLAKDCTQLIENPCYL